MFKTDGIGVIVLAESSFCENQPDHVVGEYVDEGGNTFSNNCLLTCLGDANGDGVVGIGDFLLVLAQWGPCPPGCFADIDDDGTVGILDFLLVLANWGPCP